MPDLLTRDRADPMPAGPGHARLARERTAARVDPVQRDAAPGFATAAPDFAINGRFYGQGLTGVQRYGREIVRALDARLAATGRTAVLRLPRGAAAPARLDAVRTRADRALGGHVWEQLALPFAADVPLLNLCNTGPVLHGRQVICIHDTNVFGEPGSYRASFRLFYRAVQPTLARRAAGVTTVSRASAEALAAQFGLDLRRIAVLPNGHEHALAWRRDDAVVSRHRLGRPFVLLLGSHARHKNLDLLLRLAPSLDDLGLDLVVAGGAGSVFATEPRDDAANVRRLGRVSDDELAGLLACALCLVFPSWTEGFGLPIVEAMALGCPVVASDRASMPEVCGGAALMAAPDAPAAWLGHIRVLAGSPMLRQELAERGAAQARRFSWSASARGYLELMERLI